MEKLTIEQIRDFVIVVLAILALIVLVGNAFKTIKDWRKPHMDEAEWRRNANETIDDHEDRIKTIEDGNKVICKALLALLSHDINGDSKDKLEKAYSVKLSEMFSFDKISLSKGSLCVSLSLER